MKIKGYYVLLMIISLSVVFIQCNNDKKADNEQVQEEKPEQEDNKKPKKEKPKEVYDERGNVIERHGYSYKKSDGSIRSRDSYYYAYDDSNNVIKEVKESYNLDGSRRFKNVNYYAYNDRNLKIDLVFESYDENDSLLRTAHHSYAYNENGHKIEDIGYREDGSIKSRIIMDPNETGLLLSEEYIQYDEDGTITDHKKYYYTEYGLKETVDLLKDK